MTIHIPQYHKKFLDCPQCGKKSMHETRPPVGVQRYPEDMPRGHLQCRRCGHRAPLPAEG